MEHTEQRGDDREQHPVHPHGPSDPSPNDPLSVDLAPRTHLEAPQGRDGTVPTGRYLGARAVGVLGTPVVTATPDGGLAALEAAIDAASPEVQQHSSEVLNAGDGSSVALPGKHPTEVPAEGSSIEEDRERGDDVEMLAPQHEERDTLAAAVAAPGVPQGATQGATQIVANVADDDGSDFEMPPLVFREDVLRDYEALSKGV